jgi:hypothetical protein
MTVSDNTRQSKEKIKQVRKKIKSIIINNNLPLNRMISEIDPVFDFHKAAGKTYGISLTKQEKADILAETFSDKKLLQFVQLLISIYKKNGVYSGKRYKIKGMSGLIKTLVSEEKSNSNTIILLKTDISGSSGLTMQYPHKMKMIVKDIKANIERICSDREGTLLNWQGDGGFFLFNSTGVFKEVCHRAALAGINIMHWLLDYNLFFHRINERVRLKVILESSEPEEVSAENGLSSKIYTKINDLEKNYTTPGTMLLSSSIFNELQNKIRSYFSSKYIADYQYRTKYYEYFIDILVPEE